MTSYGEPGPASTTPNPQDQSSYGYIGADADVALYSGWINSILTGSSTEIQVNQTAGGVRKWSSVAMDDHGEFVVTWTSYGQDGGGNGPGAGVNGQNGVYARRFDTTGTALAADPNEFLVNTFTDGNQQYPQIAMDAAGDFTIVWESFQEIPPANASNPSPDVPTSYGIYGQRFVRNAWDQNLTAAPFQGPHGQLNGEFQVNATETGNQEYPSIAMDDTGDFLVVWSGNGTQTYSNFQNANQVDSQGVFMQRFDQTADTAGPTVIETFNYTPPNTYQLVQENDTLPDKPPVSTFVVVFGEDLQGDPNAPNYNAAVDGPNGANSVVNLANWSLLENGTAVAGAIHSVTFGFNATTHRYEAVVTFDSTPTTFDRHSAGRRNLPTGRQRQHRRPCGQ